jgi:hypothetical protein
MNIIHLLITIHSNYRAQLMNNHNLSSVEATMRHTRCFRIGFSALGLLLLLPALALCQATMRVGTYDSRAVALAYYNSAAQRQAAQDMQAGYQRAKAASDERKIKEFEAAGPARQELMHQQVFSSCTISNVIREIENSIPAVARDARVVLMVSKWDLTYHDPSVEYVDVTMQLVRLFNPEEKVMKWIEEMKARPPIPIDKLPRGSNY